jgi:CxxC motif-containing protein (DUF1111 family)
MTAVAAWVIWVYAPGMPVRRAPEASVSIKEAGLSLFEHEWTPGDPLAKGDGLGPVFNDRSCVACHFQGGIGGGGHESQNVMSFQIHPTPGRPEVLDGMIHRFALAEDCHESRTGLNNFFAVVPGGLKIVGTCFVETRDFDPVRTQSINATALFGAGWIDRIPAKTITFEARRREIQTVGREMLADLDAIKPGRARVLPDGRIGKFGWKAQFATLEEFVASACSNELGLGNPLMEQAHPFAHRPKTKVDPDLDLTQFRALVAFIDTLPRPREVSLDISYGGESASRGRMLFDEVGCATCHMPNLGGVAGIYSDLLLHRVVSTELKGGYAEIPQVPLPDGHPLPDEWKTPPLWGVADSAPYFHDGGSPTLEAAILRHRADAAGVTTSFENLPGQDKAALIAFLNTLKAPAEAKPVDVKKKRAADIIAAR